MTKVRDRRPIFEVKPQLNPFELYDMNSDVEDVQSARIKLAVLKAKSKIEENELDNDAFNNADDDLKQVIQLEQNDIMSVTLTPKLNLALFSEEKKIFQAITETYSKIFQALIVMLNYYSANATEIEYINRRSREFEIRLNRSVFEAKQQFISFQASLVKFSMKPKESKRQSDTSQRLHSVLRCIYLILQSYLKHLPLSGGHVYPKALFNFTDMCASLAKSANCLGLHVECKSLSEDNQRLINAAKTFEQKTKPKEKEVSTVSIKPKKTANIKKVKKSLRPSSSSAADMIKKLAKEKFGSPPVCQKAESKEVSQQQSSQKDLEKPSVVQPLMVASSIKSNDHVNSTLMDGESLITNDYFTNNNEQAHHNDVREETQSVHLQKFNRFIRKTEDKEMVQATTKSTSRQQQHVKVLEIEREELADIEDLKHCAQIRQLTSLPSSTSILAHINPLELVSSIADKVVMNIVKNVCHEAVDPLLIDKLVQAELSLA